MTTTAIPVGGGLVTALRVRQWVKNLLVVAPLLPAADILTADALVGVGCAFVMFCLLSSGVYLVNDVRDVEVDRAHPVKRFRPIASGAVAPSTAVALAAALIVGGLLLASLRSLDLVLVGATYIVIQLAYCLWLKREPVLELGAVASGFLLRALAGAIGSGIPPSAWFLLAAGFGSLFVAAGKRYAEAMRGDRDGAVVREVVRSYSLSYLRFVWTAAAALVMATYALWAFQVQVDRDSMWGMVSIVPFVLALLRYAVNVDAGHGEEPEEIILHDRMLLVLGGLWAATLVAATFS
ncbi:decaprenyl-phosphate phosphoribosyltransferase [Cellulomonas aerilata]|uniref:Decaprenyl-phosphate phosphoribosyltransferase n=1 Tax=Cellulomonas aerilata TaxID=515326 RepID=A0A512D8J2_9CELL|nr:decaprenyl-phosphate phosphoribosyltransferase [Cellulomonas aerilata]GEO32812.1 decaprenyl-phosphate phosphoribosyltransferase [Cellulomonas aerilata]